jgi:predicted nucleic acid-binding protein
MKPKVYLETTIISYLTAWRSQQLVMAAHQESTRNWWDDERHSFDLYISEAVVQEASLGDPSAAQRRLEVLSDLAELQITDEARLLARELVEKTPLPMTARVDALHIATATVHGMDYLLTWNCRHIANAAMRKSLAAICEAAGYEIPVICTPLELIEEQRSD